MLNLKNWLQGKKTYISAAALCLVAIAGFLLGYLGGTETTGMLATAGALAGLGAKSQRTADEVMTVLSGIRQAQAVAAVNHTKIDPKQLAVDLGKAVLSNFAQSGLVRSTPGGAVSNVNVTSGDPAK
jgi:hypothetical protein